MMADGGGFDRIGALDAMHRDWIGADGFRPASKRTSRFFSASDLEGVAVPDRAWLARDLVPSGTVTLLTGDGGTGKSLVALQLAVAVASGGAWLGRTVATGRAMFMTAEDDPEELHRRLVDVAHAAGLGLADLDALTIRSLAGEDALLATLDSRTGALCASALLRELDDHMAAVAPSLLILDTLDDLFPGNENDRAQARQFIGLLRGLAIRHECAVLLLAHPSLSGLNSGAGTSGSTGWNNSVRSRLYLERVVQEGYEANPDARVLITKKANYGRTGGEISLTWRDGVFIADAPETGLDRMAGNGKAERVFLSMLSDFAAQGRHVSAQPGPTYAPSIFAKHPDSEGCTKRALASAMEALLSRGALVVAQHGSGAKARSHIEKQGATPGATPGATRRATPGATPVQPPSNGGATYSLIPYSVAPALGGGAHAISEACK
jgi:RecA-family ATPase